MYILATHYARQQQATSPCMYTMAGIGASWLRANRQTVTAPVNGCKIAKKVQKKPHSIGKGPTTAARRSQMCRPTEGKRTPGKSPATGKTHAPACKPTQGLQAGGITLFCLPGNISVANHTISMGRMPQPAGERHRGRDRRCRSFLHLQPQTATSAQRRHEPRKAGSA